MTRPFDYHLATALSPGAVGVVQLYGEGAKAAAESLTGRALDARCRLVRFGSIDEGLAAALRPDWVQLMPHGGVRVMQRLTRRLRELGGRPADRPEAATVYPEARSEFEAQMLAALARAASPAAIDRLLDQPARWQVAVAADPDPDAWGAGAAAWDHLIDPPTVALVGAANVGKSTLTNFVTGRATSITADLPGTTRDWVGGLAMLPTPIGEWCVHWLDTPGLRPSADPIEQRAIALARRVVADADVIVAVRDPQTDWPDDDALPRPADLRVLNKADLGPAQEATGSGAVIRTVAIDGRGVEALAAAIASHLGLTTVDPAQPWAFCPALKRALAERDADAVRRLLAAR